MHAVDIRMLETNFRPSTSLSCLFSENKIIGFKSAPAQSMLAFQIVGADTDPDNSQKLSLPQTSAIYSMGQSLSHIWSCNAKTQRVSRQLAKM